MNMSNLFDYGWLNIGSLILGLVAWYIPASRILSTNKKEGHYSIEAMLSLTACATALWFQLAYNNYLVQIQDWSALADTTFTLNWVAAVLLIVTIALNIININRQKIREGKQ